MKTIYLYEHRKSMEMEIVFKNCYKRDFGKLYKKTIFLGLI